MNRTDIDYIIEKLEFYKPDNIYDGYNSEIEISVSLRESKYCPNCGAYMKGEN